MNIFKIFRHSEKSEEITETLATHEDMTEQEEIQEIENINARVLQDIELEAINQAVDKSLQPYLETLQEMKMMLEKVQQLENQTIEQSEKLNDTINNKVIEALASRGIHQLEEKEVEINMSARDRLAKDYKENPSKFLKNFNQ